MKNTLLLPALFVSLYSFAQDSEFKLNETYAISVNGKIEMSSSDAKVSIKGSDRNDVLVNIYRKVTTKGLSFGDREFRVDVFEDDGDLIIKERSSGSVSMMGYRREEYTIDIETPRGVSLSIQGDDDDYLIQNINGSISLDIDDGDADLRNCNGDDFDFDFDDGDITMDRGKGKLVIKSDDGDVNIKNGAFEDIEARMDDGDLEIETSLSDNGSYFFRSNDGSIYMDITRGGGEFTIYHDDTRVSVDGDFDVDRREEDETRLKLANGSAKVKMRVDDGRVRVSSR